MKTDKIITAFIVGAGIGAVLGILLAPDKGSETRAQLKEDASKLFEGLEDLMYQGKTQLQDLANQVMQTVVDKVSPEEESEENV